MRTVFEVAWLGDLAGRTVRRRRAPAGDMPWGTIDLARCLDPDDEERATSKTGHPIEHVLELGWLEAGAYARLARRVVVGRVIDPLVSMGVPIDRDRALAGVGERPAASPARESAA